MIAKRLIIHPGWSKTGTTSLQNYFATHYEKYRAGGLVYPRVGRLIDNAHHDLALAMGKREGLHSTATAASIIEGIVNEVQASHATDVLISSELLPFPANSIAFEQFCDQFENLEVVFTVRRQSELVQSLYKHLLRDPSMVFHETFVEIYAAHADWLNFDKEISRWEKWKPNAKISVVTAASNLLRDFTDSSSIPAFDTQLPVENQSPSNIVASILAQTSSKREAMAVPQREQFIAFLNSALSPLRDRYALVDASTVGLIDAMYAPSNKELAARYPAASTLQNTDSCPPEKLPPDPSLVSAYAELLEHLFHLSSTSPPSGSTNPHAV